MVVRLRKRQRKGERKGQRVEDGNDEMMRGREGERERNTELM